MAQNKNVLIKIKDDGVGIKTSDYPKLFQKFSRISNELTNNVNGSGLGLYFCKKMVNLHGGMIKVRPNARRGTTFTIVLPPRG
jgi:signal transduction histidine kinase